MGNNTLELKQQKAALVQQAQGLLANGATMTDEQRTQVKDLMKRAEGLNETIELQERAAVMAQATHQPATVRENILDKPFVSFGEQLQLIQQAALHPHAIDPRLLELNQRAAGSNVAVPADGGFLLSTTFSNAILAKANETSLLYPKVRKLPLDPGTMSIQLPIVDETSRVNGSRWGGIQMFWEGEGQQTTSSRPKFSKVEMRLRKLMGFMETTDEVLRNTSALAAIAEQGFSEELGFKLDDGVLNGTGANQLLGIKNSPALITVAKDSAQAANTFTYSNAVKMKARVPTRNRRNLAWFINVDVEPQLDTMTIGTSAVVQGVSPAGAAAYVPPGTRGNQYGLLLGYPVIPIEQAETLGTAGDVYLADLTQYLAIDQGAMRSDVSMHVLFRTDEMAFRWVFMTDGQPMWRSPLTPYKGTNTLSPFITLATRA